MPSSPSQRSEARPEPVVRKQACMSMQPVPCAHCWTPLRMVPCAHCSHPPHFQQPFSSPFQSLGWLLATVPPEKPPWSCSSLQDRVLVKALSQSCLGWEGEHLPGQQPARPADGSREPEPPVPHLPQSQSQPEQAAGEPRGGEQRRARRCWVNRCRSSPRFWPARSPQHRLLHTEEPVSTLGRKSWGRFCCREEPQPRDFSGALQILGSSAAGFTGLAMRRPGPSWRVPAPVSLPYVGHPSSHQQPGAHLHLRWGLISLHFFPLSCKTDGFLRRKKLEYMLVLINGSLPSFK